MRAPISALLSRASGLLFIGLVALGTILLPSAEASAQTSGAGGSRYSEWQGAPPAGGDIQGFITQLKALVDEAERGRAADPLFLQDLRDLIASYENPFSARLFYDNFQDGNYTSNPAWKVTAGRWSVDIQGANTGLRSAITPPGQQPGATIKLSDVIGAILLPQNLQPPDSSTYASIYSPVKISNAFKLRLELVSKDPFGRLDWGPYQGSSGNLAYRVTYFPNASPGLALQRVTPQGQSTLASYNQKLALEDGRAHVIELTRDRAGAMAVTVDGKALLNATDRTITQAFDGFLIINSGGRYTVRSVTIDGTK
ncbi:MAG: hypothetical protein ACOY3L_12450 [Pseudomonadota bacterium]